jgi:hypothetical protein
MKAPVKQNLDSTVNCLGILLLAEYTSGFTGDIEGNMWFGAGLSGEIHMSSCKWG